MRAFEDVQRSEEQYHPLNLIAVVSLVAGLLSCLALVHPILYALPVLAAALSLMAIWRIRAAAGEVSGHNLAVVGLALACLFGGWAISYKLTSQSLLSRQARQVADRWLEFVQAGELQQAHQLMLRPRNRAPHETSLTEHYLDNEESRQAFRQVFDADPTKTIAEAGQRANIRFRKTVEVLRDASNTAVRQAYTFKETSSEADSLQFELLIVRPESRLGPREWYISRVFE